MATCMSRVEQHLLESAVSVQQREGLYLKLKGNYRDFFFFLS